LNCFFYYTKELEDKGITPISVEAE